MIVTGGLYKAYTNSNTAAASIDGGISWCSLPDLPDFRYDHTQSGPVLCGGGFKDATEKSCLTFKGGVWNYTHNLRYKRYAHSVWASPKGILLIGSNYGVGINSTEILKEDGHTTESFDLEYNIFGACVIQLSDEMIVTGGLYSFSDVQAYSNDGKLQTKLPSLKNGRHGHSCGHYINSENELVYLVVGGTDRPLNHLVSLASTEILINGEEFWKDVGKLSRGTIDMKAVSLDNKIIITGGRDETETNPNDKSVFSFNIISNQWEHIGDMIQGRYSHAMSVVPVEDVADYCQP